MKLNDFEFKRLAMFRLVFIMLALSLYTPAVLGGNHRFPQFTGLIALQGESQDQHLGNEKLDQQNPSFSLEQIDEIRSPAGDFAFVVTTESADDRAIKLEVRVKDSQRSLVRYLEPRGRNLLFAGQDLWVHIAGTRREMRISPRQRLLGGAATADVARLTYADDYKIDLVENNGRGHYLIRLVKRSNKAAYSRIDLTVKGEEARLVKAVHYASSGNRAIKTIHFEMYGPVLGRERPMQLRIVDHLEGNAETTLTYSGFRSETTPDNWFNPAYLKRLR